MEKKTTKEIIDYTFGNKRELSVKECLIFADDFDLNIEWVRVEDVKEFIRRINELNSEDTEWVLEDFNNELSQSSEDKK